MNGKGECIDLCIVKGDAGNCGLGYWICDPRVPRKFELLLANTGDIGANTGDIVAERFEIGNGLLDWRSLAFGL